MIGGRQVGLGGRGKLFLRVRSESAAELGEGGREGGKEKRLIKTAGRGFMSVVKRRGEKGGGERTGLSFLN